jgi:hypothetical protein
MAESITELMERMRENINTSKTARQRIKTASHDTLGRGDLLARVISDISDAEEQQLNPAGYAARKEAAEMNVEVTEEGSVKDTESDDDGDDILEKVVNESATGFGESGKAASARPKLAFSNVKALLANPLVKQGYDEYMAERADEVRRYTMMILSRGDI